MEILVHIGLNKCGSTHIQASLAAARDRLAQAGTWYPDDPGRTSHYGLSRALGFGPEDPGVPLQSLHGYVAQADARGCGRLILSSEYLSLFHPAGAATLLAEICRIDARVRVVMFSRDVLGWVRSQFNQYVRTVDGAPYLPDINAYLDQVLAKGALRIADRADQWRNLLPDGAFCHHVLQRPMDALVPFIAFAGVAIPPVKGAGNGSLSADVLYRIGHLRQRAPRPARDAEIAGLLAGEIAAAPAPERYLEISAEHMARLRAEVIAPLSRLPVDPLPQNPLDLAAAG